MLKKIKNNKLLIYMIIPFLTIITIITSKIINGKELATKIRLELKNQVEELKANKIFPKLAVIMVGNDKASEVYVRNISKACNDVGIDFEEFLLPEETTREELLNVIKMFVNAKKIAKYYWKINSNVLKYSLRLNLSD